MFKHLSFRWFAVGLAVTSLQFQMRLLKKKERERNTLTMAPHSSDTDLLHLQVPGKLEEVRSGLGSPQV